MPGLTPLASTSLIILRPKLTQQGGRIAFMSKKNTGPKPFARRFELKCLEGHIGKNWPRNSIIGALFERWVLPGERAIDDQIPLRLAVRDGYLNFYANGQSVAKLSGGREEPRIEVHWKYIEGVAPGDKHPEPSSTYVRVPALMAAGVDAASEVERWIRCATSYADKEKTFVEQLVAANPNILDLEMGLPGDSRFKSCKPKHAARYEGANPPKVAPRMDIVAVVNDGPDLALVFWEAKLATNGELRAKLSGEAEGSKPHVCYQLDDYEHWLGLADRKEQVISAYRAAAGTLGDLAKEAGKSGQAVELWDRLSNAEPRLVCRPGIVVAEYDPQPQNGQKDEQAAKAATFSPYAEWLARENCAVRSVRSRDCENRALAQLPVTAA